MRSESKTTRPETAVGTGATVVEVVIAGASATVVRTFVVVVVVATTRAFVAAAADPVVAASPASTADAARIQRAQRRGQAEGTDMTSCFGHPPGAAEAHVQTLCL